MTKIELAELFTTISDLFPNFKFSQLDVPEQKRMLANWYARLGSCDIKPVTRRLDEYIASGNRYAPSIADLYVSPEPFDEEYRRKQAERFAALEHERTAEEVEEIERIKREAFRQLIAQRQRG